MLPESTTQCRPDCWVRSKNNPSTVVYFIQPCEKQNAGPDIIQTWLKWWSESADPRVDTSSSLQSFRQSQSEPMAAFHWGEPALVQCISRVVWNTLSVGTNQNGINQVQNLFFFVWRKSTRGFVCASVWGFPWRQTSPDSVPDRHVLNLINHNDLPSGLMAYQHNPPLIMEPGGSCYSGLLLVPLGMKKSLKALKRPLLIFQLDNRSHSRFFFSFLLEETMKTSRTNESQVNSRRHLRTDGVSKYGFGLGQQAVFRALSTFQIAIKQFIYINTDLCWNVEIVKEKRTF